MWPYYDHSPQKENATTLTLRFSLILMYLFFRQKFGCVATEKSFRGIIQRLTISKLTKSCKHWWKNWKNPIADQLLSGDLVLEPTTDDQPENQAIKSTYRKKETGQGQGKVYRFHLNEEAWIFVVPLGSFWVAVDLAGLENPPRCAECGWYMCLHCT